ncbi:MAG: T9SS type A sorting domain-containing protein [Candidatus Cloacimonas sp.]|nr:T9SS type A sorting domain-containing protein [Candidatus Cloacimonas sp.]
MKTLVMILIFTLFTITSCYSVDDEFVLVDTVFANPAYLTGTIYYNMLDNTYSYFPNETSLAIGYGRCPWGNPGIEEYRSLVTFQTRPIPLDYHLYSAVLFAYCQYYVDNSEDLIWPQYYSTPYQVQVDHLQFTTMAPEVFNLIPLASNVAVLQDSAYIGWIGTDITSSYLDDIQQSRTYSQYRLHFPPGYDVSGYAQDWASYAKGPVASPKLIVTYHKTVSNSEEVLPIQSDLINGIYPQPSRDVLNIKFKDKNTCSIDLSLYDLRGRLVHSETHIPILSGITQFNINDYPSGIYYLKVTDRHRSQIKKITIVK